MSFTALPLPHGHRYGAHTLWEMCRKGRSLTMQKLNYKSSLGHHSPLQSGGWRSSHKAWAYITWRDIYVAQAMQYSGDANYWHLWNVCYRPGTALSASCGFKASGPHNNPVRQIPLVCAFFRWESMEWLCGGAGFELRKSVCRAPGINAELPHVVNDAAPSCFLQGPLYHARHLIKCQVDRLS